MKQVVEEFSQVLGSYSLEHMEEHRELGHIRNTPPAV
jgi:hypothetical protein